MFSYREPTSDHPLGAVSSVHARDLLEYARSTRLWLFPLLYVGIGGAAYAVRKGLADAAVLSVALLPVALAVQALVASGTRAVVLRERGFVTTTTRRVREVAYADIAAVTTSLMAAEVVLHSHERIRVGDALSRHDALVASLRQSMAAASPLGGRAQCIGDHRGGWWSVSPRAVLVALALWLLCRLTQLGPEATPLVFVAMTLGAWALFGFVAHRFTHVRIFGAHLEFYATLRWRTVQFDDVMSVETTRSSAVAIYLRNGSRVQLGTTFANAVFLAEVLRARTRRIDLAETSADLRPAPP